MFLHVAKTKCEANASVMEIYMLFKNGSTKRRPHNLAQKVSKRFFVDYVSTCIFSPFLKRVTKRIAVIIIGEDLSPHEYCLI